MKITVPEDDEVFGKVESVSNNKLPEPKENLQEKIMKILELPTPLPSFVKDMIEGSDSLEARLNVLLNFTQFCRDEVFPRHAKAFETIQSRSDELQGILMCQQQDISHITTLVKDIQQRLLGLETKKVQLQAKQQELAIRLKHTLGRLQDCCKNKTPGEKRTVEDLQTLKTQVDHLNKQLQDTTSRADYYVSQVKVQSESPKKYIKPLYLDKNRTIFLRSNLTTMRQNIEDLIQRIKILNKQATELSDKEPNN